MIHCLFGTSIEGLKDKNFPDTESQEPWGIGGKGADKNNCTGFITTWNQGSQKASLVSVSPKTYSP